MSLLTVATQMKTFNVRGNRQSRSISKSIAIQLDYGLSATYTILHGRRHVAKWQLFSRPTWDLDLFLTQDNALVFN